ncbi:MAG TPA: lipid-binding protein [Flavobacterium sp.]|jgi:hypothetical protein
MKIKKNSVYSFLSFLLIAGFASCENKGYEEYDVKTTTTIAMDGEWFVDITNQASGTTLAQHVNYRTYDVSVDDDGSMYIENNLPSTSQYILRGKIGTDITALTFSSATNEANIKRLPAGATFTITEGKILKNAARSRSGNVVDSIYFKGVLSNLPGVQLIYSGHKRTGFLEDEY